MRYIHRKLESTLARYLKLFPVVGLTGPRQSGKSTLVKKLAGDKYRYVSFDDLTLVDNFQSDPERFMNIYSEKVIFDEIQHVPELFRYIKLNVDEDRNNYGKFITTGSGQFALMKGVSESLAGRIGLLRLLPFQFSEIPISLLNQSIFRGCYPELVNRNYDGWFEWYSSYLDTYLMRDVRNFSEVGNMRDFRRFIQILAAHVSQIINMSEIGRDLGISVPTIKKWISVLEASYIIFLLPPYYNNLGKRIVKSPKLFFYDTGLVSYLTGIRNRELFEKGPLYGALFENYIVSEILKKELHNASGAELFYYRTSNGVEIDLIIDRKTELEYLEIKAGYTYRAEMIKPLLSVKKKNEKGFLVYQGKPQPSTPDIKIVNYEEILK